MDSPVTMFLSNLSEYLNMLVVVVLTIALGGFLIGPIVSTDSLSNEEPVPPLVDRPSLLARVV